MKEEIEMIKEIHRYVRGELTVRQADRLWTKMIEKPEYLAYLELELDFLSLSRSPQKKAGKSKKSSTNKVDQT